MPHETGLIATIAVGFALAFVLGMAAHRLKLPPLVGYLLAGVAVGPFTPGFVGDVGLAGQLAEIGVILLMFGVGLHFSIDDLLAVRKISLPGAVAQITAATVMGALMVRFWGWSWGAGLVFGLSLSVASTVVLLRALEQRNLVDSAEGRIAVGWLIVEDLAMVLALVLLPALAGPLGGTADAAHGGHGAAGGSVGMAVLVTLGKVAAFLGVMFLVGRRVVPWLLARVARTGSRELFTLSVLAVALGVAFGAAALFGVSFALGAFFAGMVVSESDLSHQAAADALPFQDAFAVLFFVSVGMLFDPAVLIRQPLQVLGVVAIVLVGKSLAALLIVLLFRYPVRTALVVAASLAQIGEFSFILAGLGVSLGLLPQEGHSLILAGAILSITANPLIFNTVGPIERWVRARPRLASALERPAGALAELEVPEREGLRDHAVLIGYGRVGEPVARALERQGIPYVVVEQNRETVEALRSRGLPALFGDATRPGILDHAHLERARLLVISAPDAFQARQMLEHARKVNPDIDTVVRTHSDEERAHLESIGVGRAVVGERELALAIVRYVFGSYGLREDMAAVAAEMLQLPDPHSGRRAHRERADSTVP
ncbi:MAG TPA: YbaL family putative K(+) efflux transporter [Longimicrobium sp.]|nr:YbaL family putative K(+) efflux transporter [Longimicrobium sp.]